MYTTVVCLLAFTGVETTVSYTKGDHCKQIDKSRDALAAAATLHLEKATSDRSFFQGRIINGEEAIPGEFPHQISLMRNGYHICGGSVISNGWVLTAAHCVDGQLARNLGVVVDLHDLINLGEYRWFDVARIIMHPQYNKGPGGFPNDVALLELTSNSGAIDTDISTNAISLASNENELFTNQICTISGWGVTESSTGASSVLLKTDVRVYSKSECAAVWGSNILDQHICIRGEEGFGSGSCNGDSGGPLVCNGVLAGVTSWGINGCHDNGVVLYPSVYARVSEFVPWIRSTCNCV